MSEDLDIDKIEAAPWYYAEGHEGRVVALCQEVRRLRAALAEAQANEAEQESHTNNYQGHWLREYERCERMEAERDALELGLRNVRAFAMRLRRTDPEAAGHLLRFCDDAGVRARVLRGTEEPVRPGCGAPVVDGVCGKDRGKSIALCETCFDVALDRAGLVAS